MHAVYCANVDFVPINHGQDLPVAATVLWHASKVGASVHVTALHLHEALLLANRQLWAVPQDHLLHWHPGLMKSLLTEEVLKHLLSGLLLLLWELLVHAWILDVGVDPLSSLSLRSSEPIVSDHSVQVTEALIEVLLVRLVLGAQSPAMVAKVSKFFRPLLLHDKLQVILNRHELVAHRKVGWLSRSRRVFTLRLLVLSLDWGCLDEACWGRMHHWRVVVALRWRQWVFHNGGLSLVHAAALSVIYIMIMAKLLTLAAAVLQNRPLVVAHAGWLAHADTLLWHWLAALVWARIHLSEVPWHLTLTLLCIL